MDGWEKEEMQVNYYGCGVAREKDRIVRALRSCGSANRDLGGGDNEGGMICNKTNT